MKVHFVRPSNAHIEGYQRVDSLDGFGQFSNNECELIFANDILDSFGLNAIYEAISVMRSKLRIGGSIVIGGTDIRLFAKGIVNGSVSAEEASMMIASSNSMHEATKVKHFLQQLGLVIDTSNIDGTHYEFKATRPNSKD